MGIYGEPKGKGISTKHIGSHRWEPKHVNKDKDKDKDKDKSEDKDGKKNGK